MMPRGGLIVAPAGVGSHAGAVSLRDSRFFIPTTGSEFINHNVAHLLGKLLIEQTKSRAYHRRKPLKQMALPEKARAVHSTTPISFQ